MTTSPPRILFLYRECSLPGMTDALMARATRTVGCQNKTPGQDWPHALYSRGVHYELARELHAGKYDLLFTMSDPELRWRPEASLLRNVWTHVKKSSAHPSAFGIPRLTAEASAAGVPVVVYDDEDNQEIALKNWPLLDQAAVYFKAQVPANPFHCFLFQTRRTESIWNVFKKPEFQERASKVEPISAGFEVPAYLDECLAPEKKSDVFFSGGVDYSLPRKQGREILLRLRDEGLRVDIPEERLDHRSFLRRMSEAWLTLSPEGASPDSFRFYEAPMVKSVPLINNLGHRRHFPHRDREHCLYYHVEGDDLADKIRWALERKDLLREIAARSHEFVLAHHQYHQLVDFMITRGLETVRLSRLEDAPPDG
ncbi:MAG: glycosyltransferase [Verrucomicrobiota bacterium]